MSTVDVVMPCYNYGRYLERCVRSVLDQQGVAVRVLVIDDCSSDDTPGVAARLAASESRVQYRRHEKNCGHIATYNEGLLGWATADYSVLLSADDLLAPGALARATELMDRHPDVGMTYGAALVIVDDDAGIDQSPATGETQVIPGARFILHGFEQGNPVPTPSAVVRTTTQQRLGGYRAEYPHTGDLEMWARFAFHGSIGVIRDVQAGYRWHTSNMSHQHYDRTTGELVELAALSARVLEQGRQRFPEASAWSERFARGLAGRAVASASRSFNEGRSAACDAQLAFAVRTWPPVRYTGRWWRLQAKRYAGQSVWKHVRPLVHGLRGVPADRGPSPILWRGMQLGWWPEPATK